MSNRLPVLFDLVQAEHRACQSAFTDAVGHALAAGAALVEAKEIVPHGQWGAWLKQSGLPDRTAQRYMLLHRAGVKSAIVAEMGIAQAERLASFGLKAWPEEGRAIEIAGADDGVEIYALASRKPDGVVSFLACHLFADNSRDFYLRKDVTFPFMLGLLCDFPSGLHTSLQDIPAADADEFLGQFQNGWEARQ
ncbi:DUF3102 domain-containing protein [Pseudooceanicola sp.]|uniref:DUF3102 domain-containing protein n=1 Tax=Pseudooceanicola sp. TaxID=1914328 RepID=UPI0035138016